jgi:hypothetical protein
MRICPVSVLVFEFSGIWVCCWRIDSDDGLGADAQFGVGTTPSIRGCYRSNIDQGCPRIACAFVSGYSFFDTQPRKAQTSPRHPCRSLSPRHRQASLTAIYRPSPKNPPVVAEPLLLAPNPKLWTTFPTLAFTTSKEASGDWMCLRTSMFWTRETHSGSGSVRFQAKLM